MLTSTQDLAESLNRRIDGAVYIQTASSDLLPRNRCHQNVAYYVKLHPGCSSVRGWLVETLHGFNNFIAHSIVKTPSGDLLEVTELKGRYPFLEHEGTEENFWFFEREKSIQYPMVLDLDHQPINEDEDDEWS